MATALISVIRSVAARLIGRRTGGSDFEEIAVVFDTVKLQSGFLSLLLGVEVNEAVVVVARL